MAIYAWGTGEDWSELWRLRLPGAGALVADTQPAVRARSTPAVHGRLSRLVLPPGGNATADALKAPNALIAYDEMIWPLAPGESGWWESVLGSVGTNDNPNLPPSRLLLASGIVPPVDDSDWRRVAAAIRGNPKVRFAVEGYHHSSIWGDSIDDLRWYERAWLQRCQSQGIVDRCLLLLTIADDPAKALAWGQPAYAACSDDPRWLKRQADEDSCFEWLMAGCLDLGTWGHAYSTEASRASVSDAIHRAIRRWLVARYGASVLQAA